MMNPGRAGLLFRVCCALLTFVAASAGCSSEGSKELSFVGPQIEGVRDIRIVNLNEDITRKVLPRVPGLSGTFLWFPDGKRAIVYSGDAFYVAEVEQDLVGACLTCGLDISSYPAFSPDGRFIAWPATDGIYLQDTHNYSLRKVMDVEKPGWPSWSSDSQSIAFAMHDERLGIYRLDLEDGILTKLAGNESDDFLAPAYSPTQDQIAFHLLDDDGIHIMLMEDDGSQMRSVTTWTFGGEIYETGLQDSPHWDRDGKRLLFTGASVHGDNDIFVVDVGTGQVTNLTHSPRVDKDAAWSPDGNLIAFVSYRTGDWEIFVMRSDGSEVRNVSKRPATPEMNPEWRP